MQSKKYFKSVEYLSPTKTNPFRERELWKILNPSMLFNLKKSLLPKFQMTFFVGDTVHFYKALGFL